MRLYLKLSKADELLPWNYQQKLVGAFHKWLGENSIHDRLSLYSLSWLSGGKGTAKGLSFAAGAAWFISSPKAKILEKVIQGIQEDPTVAFGMVVDEVIIRATPNFSSVERFLLASPALVKRSVGKNTVFYTYKDKEVNTHLTTTLKAKLKMAGLEEETIEVAFDTSYFKAKSKNVIYKGIENKANICPVVLEGSPKAIRFAWDVGIGNSTGIGFGALK